MKSGNLAITSALLAIEDRDRRERRREEGPLDGVYNWYNHASDTPITIALSSSNLEPLRLVAGKDAESLGVPQLNISLDTAVKENNIPVVETLLAMGADILGSTSRLRGGFLPRCVEGPR